MCGCMQAEEEVNLDTVAAGEMQLPEDRVALMDATCLRHHHRQSTFDACGVACVTRVVHGRYVRCWQWAATSGPCSQKACCMPSPPQHAGGAAAECMHMQNPRITELTDSPYRPSMQLMDSPCCPAVTPLMHPAVAWFLQPPPFPVPAAVPLSCYW